MQKMIVIGVTGKAGAGKDTVADMLVEHYGFVKTPMAGNLKDAAESIFHLSHDQLYGNQKEILDPRWNMTPRRILQLLGTEAMKPIFGRDVWTKSLSYTIKDLHENYVCDRFVIPDIRHSGYEEDPDMESLFVHSLGGSVWHVLRDHNSPLDPTAQRHSSEIGVNFYPNCDRIIDNRGVSLEVLFEQVKLLMESYQ